MSLLPCPPAQRPHRAGTATARTRAASANRCRGRPRRRCLAPDGRRAFRAPWVRARLKAASGSGSGLRRPPTPEGRGGSGGAQESGAFLGLLVSTSHRNAPPGPARGPRLACRQGEGRQPRVRHSGPRTRGEPRERAREHATSRQTDAGATLRFCNAGGSAHPRARTAGCGVRLVNPWGACVARPVARPRCGAGRRAT